MNTHCTNTKKYLRIYLQGEWDIARKISCGGVELTQKSVHFKPILIDMLDVVSVNADGTSIECWMDIQRGSYPTVSCPLCFLFEIIRSQSADLRVCFQTSPISGMIKVGEKLSVVIYIKEQERRYDLQVQDCYAYDNEDYEAPDTTKLQLTDQNGCPK